MPGKKKDQQNSRKLRFMKKTPTKSLVPASSRPGQRWAGGLNNLQIEAIKKYIEACEMLNKVGLTTFDVLHIVSTLNLKWGEGGEGEGYALLFPEETNQYIMDKLGDPTLFKGKGDRKKGRKTKKRKK